MRDLARLLIFGGVALIVIGAVLYSIGRVPGDIVVRRGNFTFYFPIVTSIVLSIVLSLLMWFFRR